MTVGWRFFALLGLLAGCAEERSTPRPTPAPTPRRTWVTGDTHVHANGCPRASLTPAELVDGLVAGDVNVGAVLVWGFGFQDDVEQFTGHDHPESRPGHILHYDLEVSEFPADQTGHLVLLGLRQILFSDDPFVGPAAGVPVVEWARAQSRRTLVGMTHGWAWPADGSFPVPDPSFCCIIPFDLPVHVARGRLDFFEIDVTASPSARRRGEAIAEGANLLWSKLQSSGFRVPLTAGTDLHCVHDRLGDVRTYALIDGAFADLSYEAFLEAVRAGRSHFAIGDASLDIAVEAAGSGATAGIGEELRVAAGTRIRVRIDLAQPEPGPVTLTVNGIQAWTSQVAAGSQSFTAELDLAESGWLAVRSAWVQSSAVYVLIDDRPIRSTEAACYLKRYMDHLIGLARSGAFPKGRIDETIPAYLEARNVFEQRFREAGGLVCD